MEFVSATYRLRCPAGDAERLARQIALEQTVEVPEELIDCPRIRNEVMGRVRSVTPVAGCAESFDAVVDYPADVAGAHVGQMWNLLFGNISLKRGVRLCDVELPPSVRRCFPGPRYGIDGVRALIGVHGRPLLATALKPRGSSAEHLAGLAAAFARGGGDVVKDDHNLVDPTFDAFRERIDRCFEAVEEVNARTGRRTLYAPNLSPPVADLKRYTDHLLHRGVRAALIAPMLLGMDAVRELTRGSSLVWLAHPTFTGCFFNDPHHGIEPGLLLGHWFRWLGCDVTIFPNHGGRFTFSSAECASIAAAARRSDPDYRACWPAPAGGMSFAQLPEMAAEYGADAQFLIGGALLRDSTDLESSTRKYREQLSALFPAACETAPAGEFVSACELRVGNVSAAVLEHLVCRAGFRWDGRSISPYKPDDRLPFRDVARTELIGSFGEHTAFDVRYFEIAPGGFTSQEKHVHTHVVIGVRGAGVVDSGERQLALRPFDVAYVPPLRVHQLRNPGTEPFGFLCIVDHVRDRPQPP